MSNLLAVDPALNTIDVYLTIGSLLAVVKSLTKSWQFISPLMVFSCSYANLYQLYFLYSDDYARGVAL